MVLLHSSMVPLGTLAPDFNLTGVDDQQYSLSDFNTADFLVIIFMCNHCPYVQAIWDDLIDLEERMPESIQFVGINANSNPNYPEDSFEKMKEYAKERGHKFPYLYDEDQITSKAYDAQCTPDIFVYDGDRALVYRGAFDELEMALEALGEGGDPTKDQKHSMGCSIKWVN